MGEVDAFLEAVRDSFLGVRQPPLTADEVRDQKFSTTRPLRPGYDEQEVDVFLDEVEARLRPPPPGPRDLGELPRGLSRVVNPLAAGAAPGEGRQRGRHRGRVGARLEHLARDPGSGSSRAGRAGRNLKNCSRAVDFVCA
jgi:DivIVA domain-containing protein